MRLSSVLVAFASLALIACARPRLSVTPLQRPSDMVTLEVVNEDLVSVRVYVVRAGVRIPLGSVAGLESRMFRITEGHVDGSGLLSLAVRTHASGVIFSSELTLVAPGQVIELTLRRNPQQSWLTIRGRARE